MDDPGLMAVRRAVLARGVEIGAADLAETFVFEHVANGVSVFRPPTTDNEPLTSSAGDAPGITYVFPDVKTAVADAPRLLDEMLRKRRRQAAIDARGEPDEHPSWSIVVPKILKDLIDARGGDLAEWPPLWNVDLHSQVSTLKDAAPGIVVQSLHMDCGRIHGSFRLRVPGMDDVLVSVSNVCSIRLSFLQVPETIIAASIGEPIGRLLGHPMLEHLDVPVLDVKNVDQVTKHVWITLPYLPVPIVDAPNDLLRDWLPTR